MECFGMTRQSQDFQVQYIESTIIDGKPYIEVYKGTPWEEPVFDENKHYLWPIPLSALGQNPNLGQNPGW